MQENQWLCKYFQLYKACTNKKVLLLQAGLYGLIFFDLDVYFFSLLLHIELSTIAGFNFHFTIFPFDLDSVFGIDLDTR